ncbi:MAG TPA: sugar ABC transporter ATP-binding protein [Bauldia sp.]|nr:sugar ABC transporter ATP-binding protein [Bauldia sp.]
MERVAVDRISKSFEATAALKDVSFNADAGEVLALCGENGAGKSTLINILSGAIVPDTGTIRIDGTAVTIADPHQAIALGVATVHQELSLLPHLSVAENILLGRMPSRGPSWIIDWTAAHRRAEELLAEIGLADIDVRTLAGRLSVAQQQLVEIAKALVATPRILILDEPTAVLSAAETAILFARVRKLAATGTTVIYISHRLEEVFEISDRIVVLKDGVAVYSARTREANEDELIRAMVGRPLAAIYPPSARAPGPPRLEVSGLSRDGKFEGVSFVIGAGEIVGMFGLVGSGRTEVAKAIFGAEPANRGEIKVDGRAVAISTPEQAIASGIVMMTEDRKRDGLALDLSVLDNAGLASMSRVSRHGLLDRKRQESIVAEKTAELQVRPKGTRRAVRQLSGGNQQKIVLAKWLLVEHVRIFILDEPTRGVDIGTKVEIYRMIAGLAAHGMAILLISSEMPEVIGMADRILVMRQGRISAELTRDQFAMETLFTHAAGARPAAA